LFGFCKIGEYLAQMPDLACKIRNGAKSGFAHGVAPAVRIASPSAIGANHGWNYQSVQKQYGNSEDE
jgi:hypothetical protein